MLRNTSKPFQVCRQRCPECGSKVILWLYPNKWAGIFECLNEHCATTWSCEHDDVRIETVEPWPTSPLDNPIETEIYVCNACGVTVEDRDPVLDRLEAAYDD